MSGQIRIQDEGIDLGLVTTLNFIGGDVTVTESESGGRKTAQVAVAASGVGFVLENRTSDPLSPVTGQIWLRTDL